MPNDSTWQGLLLGVGDNGVVYRMKPCGVWEELVDNPKHSEGLGRKGGE